jgi:uncharacterized protein with von Willebrand factor type A (vWA) domain
MMMKKHLTPEELAKLEKLGWDKLMEEFQKRLAEQQKERHAGGSKMDRHRRHLAVRPTAANPEGIRIGGESPATARRSRSGRSASSATSTTPSNWARATCKIALRRLRRFAREGAADELDMDGTIAAPRATPGWLDIKMRPERHNRSRCCSSSTSAARWTTMSRCARRSSRRADRVQAPRLLLLPQLHLRKRVEGQRRRLASACRCGT